MSGPAKDGTQTRALLGDVLAPGPLHSALTPPQKKELETLESVIEGGWKTFLEVGEALAEVRKKGLYRDYGTFDEYIKNKWGYSRSYAYNLIGSAEVNEQLSSIEDIKDKPLNESQLRELIPVPEAKREEAWKSAVKLAGDKPLTAKIVHKAAQRFKPRKKEKTGKAKLTKPVAGRRINLGPALKLVEEAEGMAKGNDPLLSKLGALRELLQKLADKTA